MREDEFLYPSPPAVRFEPPEGDDSAAAVGDFDNIIRLTN
jgi:hypothetical protein